LHAEGKRELLGLGLAFRFDFPFLFPFPSLTSLPAAGERELTTFFRHLGISRVYFKRVDGLLGVD
jgi:hypothetical protein